jgi:hypothetical protein
MSKPTESRSAPAPLHANAAFVVHLTGNPADPSAVCGRAEHVTTGRSLRFSSMTELHGFMQTVVIRFTEIKRRVQ